MEKYLTPAEIDALVEQNFDIVRNAIKYVIIVNKNIVGLEYDDLFQEGCIGLLHAARTFDSSRSKFTTYAPKVVRNKLISYCRRNIKYQTAFMPSIDDDTKFIQYRSDSSDDFDILMARNDILDLLEAVKRNCTAGVARGIDILELRVKGFTNKEIAELYDVSPNYISVWLARAKKYLLRDRHFMNALGRKVENDAA